jgi:uncharacterized protein (DUF885 family)
MDASQRLDKLEKDFLREWVRRNPLAGTALGLHEECDDKLPEGSLDKELDDQRYLRRALAEFEKIDPRRLPAARAADRDFAVHMLRNWIFEREELRLWEALPDAPRFIGQSLFQILSRNYAPLGQRMRAIMKRLEKLPRYIDQSRSRLRAPVKLFVEIELETITRLPGFFNLLKDIGREHLPATPQRDLNRLIDQTQNALERYCDWLIVDVLPDCREEYALGEERYRRLLQVRGVTESPASLVAYAEEEVERLRERQREVARSIRRKVPIEDIRDMLKQQHPDTFDGVLRFSREMVSKIRQFVQRAKFVSLPEGEQIYVVETPLFLRHVLPFGGYWPPARFEPKLDGYFFVTPGDCDSDKLKEHNYGALTALALRESYAGRHAQMCWAARHPSPLRSLYEDPPLAGGWPHYVEERAREMGFEDTPPSRFMQLQAMLLAAVQVFVDARLASGKLGFPQAVDALIDHLGMDRVCAEAEVRRFVTAPGAPPAHLWGRERVKELRKTAREKMGGRFSDAFFHTALLRSGAAPLPVVRRELELRIAEELARPAEKPREEAARTSSGRRAPPPAAPAPASAAPRKGGSSRPRTT